jgi:hypothetical protein
MDKIEYRAVVKFFVKEGLTPNEIHSKFIKVYEDFQIFLKLKFLLAGQDLSSNQKAIANVGGYFADLTKNHYRDGIMALEHRWNKCISPKGDYVKK